MNNQDEGVEFLDILAIISFAIQMQNQSKIFGISDVQRELQKVVGEIHAHLERQDEKIDLILKGLNNNAIHQGNGGSDRG